MPERDHHINPKYSHMQSRSITVQQIYKRYISLRRCKATDGDGIESLITFSRDDTIVKRKKMQWHSSSHWRLPNKRPKSTQIGTVSAAKCSRTAEGINKRKLRYNSSRWSSIHDHTTTFPSMGRIEEQSVHVMSFPVSSRFWINSNVFGPFLGCYSCTRFFPLYFLANFWFRRNLGSIPLVDTNLERFAFLIPLACALCVLLCAQVFFCCGL